MYSVNTNFPCETSSIRSTYEYASARGCFYIDGNGDTWKKKTETWIDAGNPDETLTFELEGVAGPNQSTTIPACAAAIETGSADPAQYTLDDTTYSISFLDTDTDTTLSPDTPYLWPNTYISGHRNVGAYHRPRYINCPCCRRVFY